MNPKFPSLAKPSTPTDPLYSRKEAAKYLDLRPNTLAVWASKAKAKGDPQPIPIVKQGRSVRYRKSALDAFLERCQRK